MLPDSQSELREAITNYKAFLETGTGCMRTTFTDTGDGSGYVPDVEVECICISGVHAVEQRRPLRTRLQKARDAAFTEPSLRPALDALPGVCYSFNPMMDFTVNPPAIAAAFRAHVDKSWPWFGSCEYVRADVLGALDRAFARLPVAPCGWQGGVPASERSKVRAAIDWIRRDPIVSTVIGGLILATILAWIELG